MQEFSIKELREKSKEWGVPPETVDKDWVIGHYLNGIYQDEFLKENLIFKGGTCLKKLYFENYRFSEDLDFSATTAGLAKDKTLVALRSIQEKIYQETGIGYDDITSDKDHISKDLLMGYKFYLPFWGINHPTRKSVNPNRWTTSLKIEISLKEKILLPPFVSSISHPYSDKHRIIAQVNGYTLEEVLAEKLRALLQRSYVAPRDYYDLWYLLIKHGDKIANANIPFLFNEKCEIKNISFKGIESFFEKIQIEKVKKGWTSSLGNHLRILPEADQVLNQLENKLKDIFI